MPQVEIGMLCQFISRLPAYQHIPIGSLLRLWLNAQRVGQLKVYVNGYHQCVGYAVWALLSPDLEDDFIAGSQRELKEWEFNEGTSPWILNLAAAPGSLAYILEDMRDTVFKGYAYVSYTRVKAGQSVCKRVSRRGHETSMGAGQCSTPS